LVIQLKTKKSGTVNINEKQIIDFPEGVLGFDYIKKFVLLDTEDQSSPLKWMQAIDEPDLAFIVIRPADFMAQYELVISQNDLHIVKAERLEDLLVFAIVTIPSNPAEMTANLQGPIIINPAARIGKQAILLTDRYSIKHRIIDEIRKNSGTEG
jgi:flagellar assembly factor FliW